MSQVSGVPWVWRLSGVNDVQQVSGVQRIPQVQKMPLVKGVAPGSHKADGWGSGRVRGSLNHGLSPPSVFSPTGIARAV